MGCHRTLKLDISKTFDVKMSLVVVTCDRPPHLVETIQCLGGKLRGFKYLLVVKYAFKKRTLSTKMVTKQAVVFLANFDVQCFWVNHQQLCLRYNNPTTTHSTTGINIDFRNFSFSTTLPRLNNLCIFFSYTPLFYCFNCSCFYTY